MKLVSYGPCQTPALSFCVNRAEKVENFKADNYWVINCELQTNPGKTIKADSLRGQIFEEESASKVLEEIKVSYSTEFLSLLERLSCGSN